LHAQMNEYTQKVIALYVFIFAIDRKT